MERLLKIIKETECFSPHLTRDEEKNIYIGYNHRYLTSRDVQYNLPLSDAVADLLLMKDVLSTYEKVLKMHKHISKNEALAVTSFCLHFGVEFYKSTKVYELVKNKANAFDILLELRKYRYKNGCYNRCYDVRRTWEADRFIEEETYNSF